MQYTQGKQGRVYYIKLDHGEDVREILLVEVTGLDVKRLPDENGLELPVFGKK